MTRNTDHKAGGKVTIKDISAKLGISSTTVHRAIAGKEGMTDALRQKILQTAQEMGYEINYAASSIKRRTVRIAVILPTDDGCYFGNIWNGVRTCAEEARRLNVEVEMYTCNDEWHEYELLKAIADAGPEEYAGVLAFSYSRMPEVMMQLQRLVALKIKTYVIDDVMTEPEGIYCIPAYQTSVGELAGEITTLIAPEAGTVVVTEGRPDSRIHIEKLEAFKRYLTEHKPGLKIVTVKGYSTREETDPPVLANVRQVLDAHQDIVLYYAQTSGDTRLAVKVFREREGKCNFLRIGTDLNDCTARHIRNGDLTLVIDQGGFMKGYLGLNALVDSVVKHIEPAEHIGIVIDVVYQSNLRFYERAINLNNNGGKSK